MKKQEVGVVGLGKFGFPLAKSLADMGHHVVGVDTDENRIRLAQDFLAQPFIADASNMETMVQLRLQDLEQVVVSVGASMETSLLIVLNLQELGVSNLTVKAVSVEHAKVLRRMGVENIIHPEQDAARHLAHRIANPGLLDLLPIEGNLLLQEVSVTNWAGKSLRELELTSKGVMIIAIKALGMGEYVFVPAADRVLEKGDLLAAIGKEADIGKLKP